MKKFSVLVLIKTTPTLDGKADGAFLNLGNVFDTVSVKVNEVKVDGINQTSKVIDLDGLVKKGENTIEIQSASTLRNAVQAFDDAYVYKTAHEYGLLGPVTVSPYVIVDDTKSKSVNQAKNR